MSSMFFSGGSKQSNQSRSGNQAYDQISQQFGDVMGNTGEATNAMSALLGGDATGFNAYKDATGFDFLSEQGSRGITGNAAARGMLRSGSTGKALANYGNQMQNQYAQNYMNNLMGQAQVGLGAGNLVANAGRFSESSGKSRGKKGLFDFVGPAASMVAASDIRLKQNIEKVGEYGGLSVYDFEYKDEPGNVYRGVMADEVESKYPEALGPTLGDEEYKTVNYTKLKELVETE